MAEFLFEIHKDGDGTDYSERTFRVKKMPGRAVNFSTIVHGRSAEGTTLGRSEALELHAKLGRYLGA